MRDAIHRRRWRDDQSGMSLVEIMIAVFVLSVGLLALASTAITSIVNIRVSRGRQEATDAASSLLEDLRRSDFSSIALDENDPEVTDYLTDVGGCDPDHEEPLVTTSQPGGLPRVQTFGPSGRVTAYLSVSWYDDPENGDEACGDSDHDRRVKRVRVIAEWTDQDRTFSLEETTLVSDVDRGLPAPDFRLSPESGSLTFTPEDQAADPPVEKCIPHVLRNLGAEDGYDWTMEKIAGTSEDPSKEDSTTFHTASGKWTTRTFMEFPPGDPPSSPADAVSPDHSDRDVPGMDDMELLRDDDGNLRPETHPDTRLAAGDEAILWVCYRAGSNLDVGDNAEFEIDVHSLFDANRVETVTHSVEVSNTAVDWFLYDDDESIEGSDGPRVIGSGGNERLATLRMGPESDAQPEELGSASTMPDYDTDLDPYGLAGTRLAATDDHPANEIVFHEQVTEATTFSPNVRLFLYTAAETVLRDDVDDDDPTLRYRIELQQLNKNENVNQATTIPIEGGDVYDYGYAHTGSSWMLFDEELVINNGSPLVIDEDQYLRLKITCLDTSDDVCHLGYDHVDFPSALRMAVTS